MKIGPAILAVMLLFGLAQAQDIEYLTPEVIDHGKVQEGEECRGDIRFVNKSDDPVRIARVKAGCGCTTVNPGKKELAPGDTATIRYVLRTKRYNGLMRKAVDIEFAGGLKRRRFILQADVYTDILLHPKYIQFRNVALNPDTLVTETLTVNNKSGRSLVCKKIYSNADALSVDPEETVIEAGQRGEIEVTLNPSKPGRHTYYLIIETDHGLKSRIRVPVFARVHE